MSRPDLIVPIRDRRRHRRLLTLKNLARVSIVLAIFFAGIVIEANLRRPNAASDYGRLFGKQVSGQTAIAPRRGEIATPAVEDQNAADPLLVEPQRREQYLSVTATTSSAPPAPPQTIVVDRPQPSQPLLSGGIFRQ